MQTTTKFLLSALALGFSAWTAQAQPDQFPPPGGPDFGGPPPAGDNFGGPPPFGPDGQGPQAGGGPGGPGGGGPGGMQQHRQILKQFDKNGDGRLDTAERKAARASLAQDSAGGGGRGGRGPGRGMRGGNQSAAQPGQKLSPADVKSFTNALYDEGTLRTLFIQFENADWEKELSDFFHTDVDVPAKLTVDGKTYKDIGVHFRGASSYFMISPGQKRSLNLSLDYADADQRLYGYRTLDLLNSHEDPTFLRTVLFDHIARQYIPAPQANWVRVVINGENWGVYVNAQHFNKDFTKEWFRSSQGARWKVPGSPNGDGGLAYLGEDLAPYQARYELKSKDDPKAWTNLIHLCRVLNQTPADQLETALKPLLDVDGALKYLALDNVFINNDGYWTRASDYNIALDAKGCFHIVPHDDNETFSAAEGGGPGGGGPGGRGGFGPGLMLARQMLEQADLDNNQRLSQTEFTALADAWFDKLDPAKTGHVSPDQLAERLTDVLPAPPGFGPPGGGRNGGQGRQGGGRGGFGPGRFLAPTFFAAADANQDGSLTRAEWKATFAKWFTAWDTAHSGSLNEEQLRTGLTAVFPPPQFGGRGGGMGQRGGGPGGAATASNVPRGSGLELNPLAGSGDANKPLLSKLLAVPALKTRYFGYVRAIAEEWLDWNKLGPLATSMQALLADDVQKDTRKLDSLAEFQNGVSGIIQAPAQGRGGPGGATVSLKTFAEKRRAFLLNHAEVKKLAEVRP